VVLDTDAANEIDDPFAIAWALARPDRLQIEAVYATPFSFAHRRDELSAVLRARRDPAHPRSARDHDLLEHHAALARTWEQRGQDPMHWPSSIFDAPGRSLGRSLDAIDQVAGALGLDLSGRVLAGCPAYLPASHQAIDAPAVDDLIERGLAGDASDEPIYVVALGCLTTIASALLRAPALAGRLVVVWTAGYPSHAPHANIAFNLDQDPAAVRVVLGSGVPLVYLPGYHVGAQLRVSRWELDARLSGAGRIGAHLRALWRRNPLAGWLGLGPDGADSWVLWDLINIAWLLDPATVPTWLTPTPRLAEDLRWQPDPGGVPMREAWGVQRDAIFGDLFARLEAAAVG
jgi:purine nucleosidase